MVTDYYLKMNNMFEVTPMKEEKIIFDLFYKDKKIRPQKLVNMVELVWNQRLESQATLLNKSPLVFHLNHVRVDLGYQKKGFMTYSVSSCILSILKKSELKNEILEINLVHSIPSISSNTDKNRVYKKMLKNIIDSDRANAIRYQLYYPDKREEDIKYYENLLETTRNKIDENLRQ